MSSPAAPALVLRIDAKVCHVEVQGERRLVPLAGKLFVAGTNHTQPLAVGDEVLLEPLGQAIASVLPRKSFLHRRAAGEGRGKAQVLAANLTRVLVVSSVASPPFQCELVDGALAAARREGIDAALVVTKADLDPAAAQAWRQLYTRCGVPTFVTSLSEAMATHDDLNNLRTMLHHNQTAVCGLSGAGKSSLLNALVPGLALRIGSLNHIRQGRHTTTHTELLPLPGGGHVLDTPGVRNFHLFHCGSQELQFLFPEIAAQLPQCAFRSCVHDRERDCAVRNAVAAGAIAASRHDSYLRMLAQAQAEERPSASGSNQRSKPRRGRPGIT